MDRQDLRQYSNKDKNTYKDTYKNTYENIEDNETFIYESCYICEEELINTEDIMVSVDDDVYLCNRCSRKYGIRVVRCAEMD